MRRRAAAALVCSPAQAEIFLTEKKKPDDWEVSITGQRRRLPLLDQRRDDQHRQQRQPGRPDRAQFDRRYTLVGPQIAISGNPTPSGNTANTVDDKDVSTFRIRGGFASTILAFNVYKQVLPDLKLTMKLALWAGIQNGINRDSGVRQFNDSAAVDFREQ